MFFFINGFVLANDSKSSFFRFLCFRPFAPPSLTEEIVEFSLLPKTAQTVENSRECVSTGAAGAQTCRSLGHHLLHLLILSLLVLCAPAVLRLSVVDVPFFVLQFS